MKKFVAVLIVSCALGSMGAAQSQIPAPEMLMLSHRIYAVPHEWIFQQEYENRMRVNPDIPIYNAVAASYTRSFEAQQRLAYAMDAFRWKDPEFFNLVMRSYQLKLAD